MDILGFLRKKRDVVPLYDLSEASEGLTEKILANYNSSRPQGPQAVDCYAPLKSIYFGNHGNAIACCYNRKHIMGKYPEQSIKQIWESDKANELRQALRKHNFSLGCQGCLSQILAGNFDATKAKQYDSNLMNGNGYPSVMEFELDNTCNLECAMCSGDFSSLIRANREHRPPLYNPYDEAFLQQLEEFIPYLEEVKFYGGEPFLIETYYRIIEMIIRIKPSIHIIIQTNGTIWNNRVKNLLAKAKATINLSLDSLQKETYEGIRINAKFERVMEHMQHFRQYCKEAGTTFYISACLMRTNWHELPDFVRFCNERDVEVYFHTVFYPLNLALRTLPREELLPIAQQLEKGYAALPESNKVEQKNKQHLADAISQILFWYREGSQVVNNGAEIYSIDDLINYIDKQIAKLGTEKAQYYLDKRPILMEKLQFVKQSLPVDHDFYDKFSQIEDIEHSLLDNLLEYSKEDILIYLSS